MESADPACAIDAAISIAVALDLPTDDAAVLQNSNKLALRLLPCDVFARVAHVGHEHAAFEVELAHRLAETASPVAALEPRVERRGDERDGFEVTLWTYYEPASHESAPTANADALERLHAGMRQLDVPTPHFTDRAASAERGIPISNDLGRVATGPGVMTVLEVLLPPGEPSPDLVAHYGVMAAMETAGFATCLGERVVAFVGGLAMQPVAWLAVARLVGQRT